MELRNPSCRLKCVDLTNNPIETDSVLKILKQVETYSKQDLFDESPILILSSDQPEEVYSLAKEKRWIVHKISLAIQAQASASARAL